MSKLPCMHIISRSWTNHMGRYYPTNAEIEVLEAYAEQIARRVQPGSVLVELGSGYVSGHQAQYEHRIHDVCCILTLSSRNLRKVNILLQAIDRLGKDVEYFAVDLSLPELERTFSEIPTGK